jgi:uncharacterized RmlC-like cupin family protein
MTQIAGIVDQDRGEQIGVLGPTIRFLTPPDGATDLPCLMRGTIPPGGMVPLHSHADPETFLALSGTLDGLSCSDSGYTWIRVEPGDMFHVPGDARHAWRNPGEEPAVMIIATTCRIGTFFREVAPADGEAPEDVTRRFLEVSARYGYWNATPEENVAVGLGM